MVSTYYTQVCTCTHKQTTLLYFQGLFWEGNWNCLPREHTAATVGQTHGSNVCDVVGMWVCVGVMSSVYLAVELPKLRVSPVNIPLLRLHLDKHLLKVVKLHRCTCDLTCIWFNPFTTMCKRVKSHTHRALPHTLTVVTRFTSDHMHLQLQWHTHIHHTW